MRSFSLLYKALLRLLLTNALPGWFPFSTCEFSFFDTQISSGSIEKLVLPRHACCVLSRVGCNVNSLLTLISQELAQSKIFHATPEDMRLTTLPVSLCTIQPQTLCIARFIGDPLSPYALWLRFWGVARLLGSTVSCHALNHRKGLGNNTPPNANPICTF